MQSPKVETESFGAKHSSHFVKFEQHYKQVLPNSFYMNGHTLGFYPRLEATTTLYSIFVFCLFTCEGSMSVKYNLERNSSYVNHQNGLVASIIASTSTKIKNFFVSLCLR